MALATKGLDIVPASLCEIASEIVAQPTAVAKLALAGRELGIECPAVAEADGVVKVAKGALRILALVLLLVLLALAASVPVVPSPVTIALDAAAFGIVIINSVRRRVLGCGNINEVPSVKVRQASRDAW